MLYFYVLFVLSVSVHLIVTLCTFLPLNQQNFFWFKWRSTGCESSDCVFVVAFVFFIKTTQVTMANTALSFTERSGH